MSYAREIAQATNGAAEAAVAIRETLARVTPDLVAESGPWNVQADLLAGAVSICAADLGKIKRSASIRYADAIRAELGVKAH